MKEDELCGKFIYAFDTEEQIEQTFRSAAGEKAIAPVSPEEKGKHLRHTKRGILQQTDRHFPQRNLKVCLCSQTLLGLHGARAIWGRNESGCGKSLLLLLMFLLS